MALTLYENYQTGDNTYILLSDYVAGDPDDFRDGQTFTPQITHSISRIDLKLFRVGTVTNVTIELRTTTDNKPDGDETAYGDALASITVNVSGITTDTGGQWVAFAFNTPVALTASTKYAIVIKSTISSASHNVQWRVDSANATYTRGDRCRWTSPNWTLYDS